MISEIIDPKDVHTLRIKCQFDHQIHNKEDLIFINPIGESNLSFELNKSIVNYYSDMIDSWFLQMDEIFFEDKGGGWPFYNMSTDKNGNVWCQDEDILRELVALGIANDRCYLLPNQINAPYIVVKPIFNF